MRWGWAFITNNKSPCHDLGAGWWPKGKSLVQMVVAHAFNPSTREGETGRSLSSRPTWSTEWVPGQPGLHREALSQNKQTNKLTFKNPTCVYSYLLRHYPPPYLQQFKKYFFSPPLLNSHIFATLRIPITSTITQTLYLYFYTIFLRLINLGWLNR